MAGPYSWPRLSRANWDKFDDALLPIQQTDFLIVGQWDVSLQTFISKRTTPAALLAALTSSGTKDIAKENVSVSPGLVPIGGKTINVAVAGSKATDAIVPIGFSGGLNLGVVLSDAAISVDGTMRLQFNCTLLAGLTVGTLTFNYLRYTF